MQRITATRSIGVGHQAQFAGAGIISQGKIFLPLQASGQLKMLTREDEIIPGFNTIFVNGHTRGDDASRHTLQRAHDCVHG